MIRTNFFTGDPGRRALLYAVLLLAAYATGYRLGYSDSAKDCGFQIGVTK